MKGWYVVKQHAKIINKLPVIVQVILAGPYGNLALAQSDIVNKFMKQWSGCIFMAMEYVDNEE